MPTSGRKGAKITKENEKTSHVKSHRNKPFARPCFTDSGARGEDDQQRSVYRRPTRAVALPPNHLHAVDFHQGGLSFRRQIGDHLDELAPGTKPGTDVRHGEFLRRSGSRWGYI